MKTEKDDVNLILDLFRGSAIFSRLDAADLKVLAAYCEITCVKQNEAIFKPGERGNCLYIISEGSVVIQGAGTSPDTTGSGGSQSAQDDIVARFKAGESFGELEFFNSSERSAYAIAETDTTVVQCPGRGSTLEELLEKAPKLTAHLMHNFLNAVADRIRTANNLVRENSVWVRELRNQMYTDKLTGLYNRTYLEENFGKYRPDNAMLGLLMIKPDNFKVINDTFGHEAGDAAIQKIADVVAEGCQESEVPVRYMGNEFAVILTATDTAGIGRRADYFRELVCGIGFADVVGKLPVPLTASVGVYLPTRDDSEWAGPEGNRKTNHSEIDYRTAIEATHAMAMKGRTIGGRKILYVE